MPSQRATVITVIAWTVIVFSGLGLINALLFLTVPASQLMPPLQLSSGAHRADPAVMQLLMRRLMLISALIDAWILLSGIGLLRRQGWARISVIVIAAIGAGMSGMYALLGGTGVLVLHRFPDAVPVSPQLPMSLNSLLMLVALCGLLFLAFNLWVLVKLLSKKLVGEFVSGTATRQRDQ